MQPSRDNCWNSTTTQTGERMPANNDLMTMRQSIGRKSGPILKKCNNYAFCPNCRLRAEELRAIQGMTAASGEADASSMLAAFDSRTSELEEYFATHAEASAVGDDASPALRDLRPHLSFAGSEVYGQFVDLTTVFEAWTSVEGGKELNAMTLCDALLSLELDIAEPLGDARLDSCSYRRFLLEAAAYLCGLYDRCNPLAPSSRLLAPLFEAFRAEMLKGSSTAAIKRRRGEDEDAGTVAEGVDLSSVGSASELEELGLDELKLELMRRGLKCG